MAQQSERSEKERPWCRRIVTRELRPSFFSFFPFFDGLARPSRACGV